MIGSKINLHLFLGQSFILSFRCISLGKSRFIQDLSCACPALSLILNRNSGCSVLPVPADPVQIENRKIENMNTQARNVLLMICDAVIESVKAAGPLGAPGGVIYSALMAQGCTIGQFESIMSALVSAGKLRREGHIYFAA